MINTISTTEWNSIVSSEEQTKTTHLLESGEIIYFPKLAFSLTADEKKFLDANILAPKIKNVSLDSNKNALKGTRLLGNDFMQLQNMMMRYADHSKQLLLSFMPHYTPQLEIGRTSFRPAEIDGRVTSPRKDDTRLHIDAFPATPNQGKRILRVFSNVNPIHQSRLWKLGEPFETVAKTFLPTVKKPIPGSSWLMEKCGLTKSHRTHYDHVMLQIHDNMKMNNEYQKNAVKMQMDFPADTTWIVQTDQVSHAALRGQFILEQTFYLPVDAMLNSALSPLRVLERLMQKKLV
jgi:3-deoxy-D-manno-oct-2-ulosonic acid (Kdo) hydroxylase